MAQSKITIPRPRTVTSSVTFLLSLLAILLVTVDIKAQPRKRSPSGSSPAACDDLAAHPEDKNRKGAGVADEKIVSGPAIEKCALAVKQSPNVARFHFQLGRAFWMAKRYDDALDAFLKAEEKNYAPAYFYLAQAYEQGLIKGEQADPATARNLYMIAAAEGFEPAVRAYGEFEEAYEIDFEAFVVPPYTQVIYEGEQLGLLNRERRTVLAYIRGMQHFLERKTDIVDPACAKISDPKVITALNEIINVEYSDSSEGFLAELARTISARENAEARNAGEHDMHRMVAEYGGCLGAPVTRFYANAKQYLHDHPAKKDR